MRRDGVKLVELLVLALVTLGSSASADVPRDRAAYVERTLAAVRALGAAGRDRLDRDLYAAARSRCHADSAPPTGSCLAEASRAHCAGNADCEAAADVVAANLLSIADFLDDATRVRLVRGSTDYRAALAAALRKRYASLAAELAIAGPAADGAAIDRLCADRDRTIHACTPADAGCIPSLPWSRCVAAVVWFVGGTP
jgi:hypothetical protein